MRRMIALLLIVSAVSAAGTYAQGRYVPGWTVSDTKTSVLKRLEGRFFDGSNNWGITVIRKADEGSIVTVLGTFSYIDDSFQVPKISGDNIQISGRAIGTRPTIEVPQSQIKLSGSEGKQESWSFEPIAIAIDTANGCSPYWFLDSKDQKYLNGFGPGGGRVSVEGKSLKLISPITLCLAFPAPASRHDLTLQFGETKTKLR